MDLTEAIPQKILRKYYQLAVSKSIWEFKSHPEEVRYALLAIFLEMRRKVVIDDLIEILIQIIHKIKIKSQKKVTKTLVKQIRKIHGKEKILLDFASASLENPKGIIEETLYPIIGGKKRLKALVEDLCSSREYGERVQSTIRRSYSSYYRQIIPIILDLINFRSNNRHYKPIIEALEIIKKNIESKATYFPQGEKVPIKGVISNQMKEFVIEKEEGKKNRFNRINYEICTFQALRDRLRCKEVWARRGRSLS